MLSRFFRPAVIGLALIALAGCAVTAPQAPSPSGSAAQPAPIFATDEEALAAATKAYAAYLAVSDAITANPDADSTRIADVVSQQNIQNNVEGFLSLAAKGSRSIGATVLDSPRLQGSTVVGGRAHVVVYLCIDVSGIRLYDVSGADVTPSGRSDRVPVEATLVSNRQGSQGLLVDRTAPWTADSFC